jgi:hypothetical protein
MTGMAAVSAPFSSLPERCQSPSGVEALGGRQWLLDLTCGDLPSG